MPKWAAFPWLAHFSELHLLCLTIPQAETSIPTPLEHRLWLPRTPPQQFVPPPFRTNDIDGWLLELEVRFRQAGTYTSLEKIDIAAALPSKVLRQLHDVVFPTDGVYYLDILLDRLRRVAFDSEVRRVRRLLQTVTGDDRRPSEILSEMLHLAGTAVPETLIRELWLDRLPQYLKPILVADNRSLQVISQVADRLWESESLRSQQVHAVSTSRRIV